MVEVPAATVDIAALAAPVVSVVIAALAAPEVSADIAAPVVREASAVGIITVTDPLPLPAEVGEWDAVPIAVAAAAAVACCRSSASLH